MNLTKFTQLKQRVDEAKREKDRSEGALEQLVGELQQDFNCRTLKEARIERDKMDAELSELESSAEEAMSRLEQEYPQLFEEET